jgi:hypothetical protein
MTDLILYMNKVQDMRFTPTTKHTIATLKSHQQGLMQQLFPNVEKIES